MVVDVRNRTQIGAIVAQSKSMPFRVRPGEPIGKGLERNLGKQLRSAIDQLARANASDEAIHESRKSIKKARAILLLVPKDLRDQANRDIERLRGAGRLLAPLRDVDAMVNTAGDLCNRYAGAQQKETCEAVRRTLAWHKTQVQAEGRRDGIPLIAARTLRSVRGAKRWRLKRTGFSRMVSVLRWDHKRAQRAMARAEHSHQDTDFHRWRRRVKVLWYHLRLLEVRASTAKRRADELKLLDTWLGEDHNLAVLRAQMDTEPGLQGDKSAVALVIELSARRREELRRDALSLGARVFAERPRDAFSDLHQIWQPRISRRPVTDVRVADFTGQMCRRA
jgi:CHAD domain-containing protein